MKKEFAIALLVCGTALVALPAISDYMHARLVVALMRDGGVTSVNLAGRMEELYRLGCYLAGIVMVVVAVAGASNGASDRLPLPARAEY